MANSGDTDDEVAQRMVQCVRVRVAIDELIDIFLPQKRYLSTEMQNDSLEIYIRSATLPCTAIS